MELIYYPTLYNGDIWHSRWAFITSRLMFWVLQGCQRPGQKGWWIDWSLTAGYLIPVRSIGDLLGQTNTDQVLQKLCASIQTVNSRCGSQALDIQNLYRELKNLDSKLEKTLHTELRCLQAEISGNFSRPKSTSTSKRNVPCVRGSSSIDRSVQRLEAAMTQIERKVELIQNDQLRFENATKNKWEWFFGKKIKGMANGCIYAYH